MSKRGHRITSAALAVVAGIVALRAGADAIAVACLCVSIMAGALAPDYLEVAYGDPKAGQTVIAHRTWTHQPVFWLLGIVLLFAFWTAAWWQWALAGWLASGLFHLAMDIFSVSGIPLAHPRGRRTAVVLYRTSGWSENVFILLVMGVLSLACLGALMVL